MSKINPLLKVKPDYRMDRPVSGGLYTGDCRKVMAKLPPASVDTIFADPPFNFGKDYPGSWDDNISGDDYQTFSREWVAQALRLLKPGGSIFVNCPDVLAPMLFMLLQQKRQGFKMTYINTLIWHYRFGNCTDGRFIDSHAQCLYFSKIAPSKVSQRKWYPDAVLEESLRKQINDPRVELSKRKGMRVALDVWYGENLGRVQGNNAERVPKHPNQLPEMYLARVIRCSTLPGDMVLDPFAGTGTTLAVAKALKRKFIGIEMGKALSASCWRRVKKGAVRKVDGPI